jgi:hypothetical protein
MAGCSCGSTNIRVITKTTNEVSCAARATISAATQMLALTLALGSEYPAP